MISESKKPEPKQFGIGVVVFRPEGKLCMNLWCNWGNQHLKSVNIHDPLNMLLNYKCPLCSCIDHRVHKKQSFTYLSGCYRGTIDIVSGFHWFLTAHWAQIFKLSNTCIIYHLADITKINRMWLVMLLQSYDWKISQNN